MPTRLLQAKVSSSKLTLPVTVAYAALVWVAAGMFTGGWWLQAVTFLLTAYVMVLLNNVHALIRIYSRTVSAAFIMLACAACFLFPSLRGALMQLFFAAFYLLLFLTYQDKQSPGTTFYAFTCYGMASLCHVELVCLLPLFWMLMATCVMSLSWRTWAASLLGLLAPYWFICAWLFFWNGEVPFADFLLPLADLWQAVDYAALPISRVAVYVLLAAIAVIGTVHFIRKSYHDKIRIRMFFWIFMWVDLVAALLLALQPRHADILLRLMVVNTAPLAGHFIALTATKATNAVFIVLTAATIALTILNLWTPS